MNAHNSSLKKNQALIEHLVNRRPYSDSIRVLMYAVNNDLQVYPKTSGFDALNSIGLNLLSNDSLRIEITNLYQLYLQRTVNAGWRETPSENIKQLMGPYLRRYIAIDINSNKKRIVKYASDSIAVYITRIKDYNNLLADNEFQKQLYLSILLRVRKIDRHFRVIHRIEQAIISIKKELKQLEN